MTYFNYWHFISFGVILLILIGGIVSALSQSNKKLVAPMILSTFLISMLFAGFSIVVVDKYTKKVKLYKLKNKRLLSTEQIIYTGIVKNEGKFTIGKVKFEIKLVNKGHMTGNVKGGTFYKSSGFFDFFSNGLGIDKSKPQTVTKEFVVAKNLKAGEVKTFRVHFRYPAYFKSTAEFAKVYGH
jgi:hypothetical protein